MAEMLIVVAIIGVLGAVAFVAVNQHQRSLERLERDSVAREIFIAAQNHLTMAQSQGYLGLSDKTGTVEDEEKGYYFFVVNQGSAFSSDATPQSLIDLMLPYGSIDETVRGGGSYIIRYHPESGTVLDVFYCSSPAMDSRFGYSLSASDEKNLVSDWRDIDDKRPDRKNYKGKVLGWYGGEEAETLKPDPASVLEAPLIVVENSDKLRVGVVDKNAGGSLQIVVTGLLSKVQKVFNLKSTEGATLETFRIDSTNKNVDGTNCSYVVILDDITTSNMHFADMTGIKNGGDAQFTPGEDIVVQAIAFDNTQISNIGYSAQITVNSLYEKLEEGVADVEGIIPMTASIGNIRHLENLDKTVSYVADSRSDGSYTHKLNNAVQTSDLKWDDFDDAIKDCFKDKTNASSTGIVLYGSNAGTTGANNYLPVVPTNALTYNGQNHSVTGIKVSYAGNKGAGMFGSITGTGDATNPTKVSNLALIDFDIAQTGTGNIHAGALAGTLTKVDVENVIAYNNIASTGIVANSGDAGGLIGSATNCNITKSAAALTVKSTSGNAGGLIGKISGTTDYKVYACYSGGHTTSAAYSKTDFNVTATGSNAGGLIGEVVSTPIDHCYSTCSVTGKTAGGFVASTSSTIKNCYATGLVKGTDTETIGDKTIPKDGAFAYSIPAATGSVSDCYYLEIINEREDADLGYTYLTALGKEVKNSNIKPLDADCVDDPTLNTYYNVFANPDNWTEASAYDPKLIEYYKGKYNLQTVAKLGATGVTDADFVATHYGDWPAPEIFVVNTKSSN